MVSWIVIASKTTVDTRIPSEISSGSIASWYLHHPTELIRVIWATLSDRLTLLGYFSSFFGILGWLTAAFKGKEYIVLLTLCSTTALVTFPIQRLKTYWWRTPLLVSCVVPMIGLIFFAMLTTWTPHPAKIIIGVQGRYFLIPAIVLAYGVFCDQPLLKNTQHRLGCVFLSLLGLYSFINTTHLLLDRYYVSLQ